MKLFKRIIIGLWVILAATAQGFAQTPLEIIDRVLAEAEATPNARYSYTMTFMVPGQKDIVMRYEAEAKDWILQSGDPDSLPGKDRQKLRNVMKSESVPGGLLYADFRQYLQDIQFREEADGFLVYAFVPPEADGNASAEDLDEIMKARLYVDKDTQILQRYEVKALEAFSPFPMSRLEQFEVIQDFKRLSPESPAVLTRMYSKTYGRRAFRAIDTEFTALFSDFVPVN